MIIDAIEIDDLSENSEEAFIVFEERLRAVLMAERDEDRRAYRDGDGYYRGSYSPERYYVSSILAFLDEYDLDIEVADILDLGDQAFINRFDEFFNKINYARTRLKLRKARLCSDQIDTLIIIKPNFRTEIHHNLNTIRKIINGNVSDKNKRDAIYKKIAALQSEIDRDRTTVDAVFGRLIDLSRALSDSAENLEPLVQKIERVAAALWKGADSVPLLSKKERPKLLPTPEGQPINDLDDDIPF
jgi:hypothetical protein